MTRNDFLRTATVFSASLLTQKSGTAQGNTDQLERELSGPSGATIKNAEFQLTLTPRPNLRLSLIHASSGMVLADGPYSYSFGQPQFDRISTRKDGGATIIVLEGTVAGAIGVKHEF